MIVNITNPNLFVLISLQRHQAKRHTQNNLASLIEKKTFKMVVTVAVVAVTCVLAAGVIGVAVASVVAIFRMSREERSMDPKDRSVLGRSSIYAYYPVVY